MSEGVAFTVFVTVFMGGLVGLTVAMLAVAVALLRRNRTARVERGDHVLSERHGRLC